MNTLEDRARAAMRAIADTVDEAPPLALPPTLARFQARRARLSGRWRLWIAPVTAAVAVIAIAVSLAVVRSIPNGRVAPAHSPTAPVPGGTPVPEYYAGVTQSRLLVGNTFTGEVIATVSAPPHMVFTGVSGAADDRTFAVTTVPPPLPGNLIAPPPTQRWYLLRIAPGTARPARLTRLPIPLTPTATGFALSPDGSKLAAAVQYPGGPQLLRLYSVATGAVLRTWSTNSGEITATPAAGASMHWTADGRKLAFAANTGTGLWVLDIAAPVRDLLTASHERVSFKTVYTPAGTFNRCVADAGWSVSADGQTITCPIVTGRTVYSPGSRPNAGHPTTYLYLGFGQYISKPSYGEFRMLYTVQVSHAASTDGASLGWASPDGTVLVGSVRYAGHTKFGIFRGKNFAPLPPPPPGIPLTSIAW